MCRNIQEDVGTEAQGAAEGFREAGKATEGNESFRKINETSRKLYCIVLYSNIYIAPLNSHGQAEALLVRLAPRKETSFKK